VEVLLFLFQTTSVLTFPKDLEGSYSMDFGAQGMLAGEASHMLVIETSHQALEGKMFQVLATTAANTEALHEVGIHQIHHQVEGHLRRESLNVQVCD
jgi:NADH:ubiquinone oxidoreductase subunit K